MHTTTATAEPKATKNSTRNSGARVTAKNVKCITLFYDVPQAQDDGGQYQVPYSILWRNGFRINLSAWMIPLHRLPALQDMFAEFDEHNLRWDYYELEKKEWEHIQQDALAAYEKELGRIRFSMLKALDKAQTAFEAAEQAVMENEEGDTEVARINRYRAKEKAQHAALKKAAKLLDSCVEGAMMFDEDDNMEHHFDTLRQILAAQQEAFNAAVEARKTFLPSLKVPGSGSQAGRVVVRAYMFGHPITSVIRWMGKQGYDFATARKAMQAQGVDCADATIRAQLLAGRKGQRGEPAQLTEEQVASLKAGAAA